MGENFGATVHPRQMYSPARGAEATRTSGKCGNTTRSLSHTHNATTAKMPNDNDDNAALLVQQCNWQISNFCFTGNVTARTVAQN